MTVVDPDTTTEINPVPLRSAMSCTNGSTRHRIAAPGRSLRRQKEGSAALRSGTGSGRDTGDGRGNTWRCVVAPGCTRSGGHEPRAKPQAPRSGTTPKNGGIRAQAGRHVVNGQFALGPVTDPLPPSVFLPQAVRWPNKRALRIRAPSQRYSRAWKFGVWVWSNVRVPNREMSANRIQGLREPHAN